MALSIDVRTWSASFSLIPLVFARRSRSSARLTDHYTPEQLIGSTVVAVVNLPPRQIGPVRSEVLVVGVYVEGSERVVLLRPDRPCAPGDRIG